MPKQDFFYFVANSLIKHWPKKKHLFHASLCECECPNVSNYKNDTRTFIHSFFSESSYKSTNQFSLFFLVLFCIHNSFITLMQVRPWLDCHHHRISFKSLVIWNFKCQCHNNDDDDGLDDGTNKQTEKKVNVRSIHTHTYREYHSL